MSPDYSLLLKKTKKKHSYLKTRQKTYREDDFYFIIVKDDD